VVLSLDDCVSGGGTDRVMMDSSLSSKQQRGAAVLVFDVAVG
jgi:hypothetical protein